MVTRWTYTQMLEAYNIVAENVSEFEKDVMARMILEVVNDPGLTIIDIQREAETLAMIQGR